jgi:hypothetical protein
MRASSSSLGHSGGKQALLLSTWAAMIQIDDVISKPKAYIAQSIVYS